MLPGLAASARPAAQETEAKGQQVSIEGRTGGGFLSSLFSSSSASSGVNSRNFLQLVDYVRVTKVEPPFCVACSCLKGGLTATCAKHNWKVQVTLTTALNGTAGDPAKLCTQGTDGITFSCNQDPVTFSVTATLTNGGLTVGETSPGAGKLGPCKGAASPLQCDYTLANGTAIVGGISVPYELTGAGIAPTSNPSANNTAVKCSSVATSNDTLLCTYTPPASSIKVTVAAKAEASGAAGAAGAMCTVSGTTVTCLIDPPPSLSVCDKSCVDSDGKPKTLPDICDSDCKSKKKNEVVKCNEGYPDIISARPTQVCSSVRKREVPESEVPAIESSLGEVIPRRHPRQFQLFRTTSTTTETATGSVTATYVAKAKCLPVNLLSVPDC